MLSDFRKFSVPIGKHSLRFVVLAPRRGRCILTPILVPYLKLMDFTGLAGQIFPVRSVKSLRAVLLHHYVELIVNSHWLCIHKLRLDFFCFREGLVNLLLHLFEVSVQLHLLPGQQSRLLLLWDAILSGVAFHIQELEVVLERVRRRLALRCLRLVGLIQIGHLFQILVHLLSHQTRGKAADFQAVLVPVVSGLLRKFGTLGLAGALEERATENFTCWLEIGLQIDLRTLSAFRTNILSRRAESRWNFLVIVLILLLFSPLPCSEALYF